MASAGVSIVFLFFIGFFVLALTPIVLGIYALVAILTTPEPAFGPWWDNTKTAWIIGALVSFAVPFGGAIVGIMWIQTGRKGLHQYGVAGRPFWAGGPKPPPYYPGQPPFPGQPPYPGQPPHPGQEPYPPQGPGPAAPPAY